MNAEGNNQYSISDEKVNSYAEGIKISWICSIDAVRREQRETDNKGVSDDTKVIGRVLMNVWLVGDLSGACVECYS